MTEQGEAESPAADPYAEVRVIDSQLQHFSNYIDVIQVFKCRICSFCSPLEHVIASHMSEVHFPRRCFLCKQCLFVFETRSQLNSHLDSAHGTRSIAVCFGESGPFVNSPPTWHAGVGRSSEDDEQLSRQSTEEQAESEPNNGRVTSSTGNLANLPDEGQMERGNSTSSLTVPAEGEFFRRTPSGGESHQEQVLSRASSCNPTTTDQELTAIPEPIKSPLQQDSSSTEQTSRQGSQESPERVSSETPKLNDNHENYIKTEPVSPVQVFMCPKRRRLLQTSYSGESTDNDVEAKGSAAGNKPERSPLTKSQSESDATPPDPQTDNHENRRASISSLRSNDGSGRRSDVLRGLLRRQRSIEDIDAEVPPPSEPSRESPKQGPPTMPRSISLTNRSPPTSCCEPLPRQSSEPIVRVLERHEEVDETKKPEEDSQESEGNDRSDASPRGVLGNPINHTIPKPDNRQSRKCSTEGNILRKTGSIDETSTGQPAPRSHRQRSYSLTDGDSRLPTMVVDQDLQINRPPQISPEKEYIRAPLTFPPSRSVAPYLPRYPASLVRQPYAVDSDPGKMWRSLPSYQSQASVSGDPPAQSRPHSDHSKGTLPTQMSEDSFLYSCLRPQFGPRRRRNPAALTNQHSADGVPSHWVGHNQYSEAGRAAMIGYQGHPWPHYPRGMPHHMLMRQNADDKSASPTITSSTPHRLGLKPDIPMYSPLERSASQPVSGEKRQYERRRAPMLGQVGASSESSQELAHAEDITRQVQKAISIPSDIYSDRSSVPWGDQSSGNSTSMDETNGKDSDFKKRSRKSTFNIYREIPERKRKLDRDEEERIKSSYNADGSFDYFSLTGWKAYKCDLCKKRRFKTASELEEHKRRKHSLQHTHIGNASSSSSSGIGASLDDGSSSPQLTPQLSNG